MDMTAKRIAVVQGSSGVAVQGLFRILADRWRPTVRMAGVLAEDHGLADRSCSAGFLRSLGSGELFPMFQDLGPGAAACHLEGAGVVAASDAVRQDIARGCDLVLLSKFGKLEAKGEGLCGAFRAAIAAGIPLLTSVSPALAPAWARFAPDSFVLPADLDEVEKWWRTFGMTTERIDAPRRNLDRPTANPGDRPTRADVQPDD